MKRVFFQRESGTDEDGMQVGNKIVWKPRQQPQVAPQPSNPVGVVSGPVEQRQAPRPMPMRGRIIMQRPPRPPAPTPVPQYEYPTGDRGGPIRTYVNPADGENTIIERMSGDSPDLVAMKATGAERSGQFLSVSDLQAMGEPIAKGVQWSQGAGEVSMPARPESPPLQGPSMVPADTSSPGNVPPPLDLSKPAPLPVTPLSAAQWVPPAPAPATETAAPTVAQPVVQEVKTP